MATPHPSVVALSEMLPGQHGDCFVLLAEKASGTTRDGKPYFRVTFRDNSRSAQAMIWSDSVWFTECSENWQEGAFYKLRCVYLETDFGPQLDIERIRPVREEDRQHGFDPGQLVPSTRFDVDEMFAELCTIARDHIHDPALQRLTLSLLEQNEAAIKVIPAAARNHHAFRGGYLEHTLSVARLAVHLAEKYAEYYPDLKPPLAKELVVAGAILHDIGKVRELVPAPDGGRYTAAGRLVGHIAMGRDMIRDAARQIPELNPETLLRLEHIILSHQGQPEWGSPITPHTPEALLVHYADDIDAKFHEAAMALMQAPDDDSEFTSYRNPLHRRIFRGLQTPADAPEVAGGPSD